MNSRFKPGDIVVNIRNPKEPLKLNRIVKDGVWEFSWANYPEAGIFFIHLSDKNFELLEVFNSPLYQALRED
jgi:hypothetical protein